jgi:hypothetical protein
MGHQICQIIINNMANRPNRTAQDCFDVDGDHSVQFVLVDPNHVQVTVPAKSQWGFPIHWHTSNPAACSKITCLKGRLQVYTATPFSTGDGSESLPPGSWTKIRPGDHMSFRCHRLSADEGLVALLEVDPSQTVLLRNTYSATLDADLYPSLASTPYWVRLLYLMLQYSPQAQRNLTAKLLWVQVQMMRSRHDLYVRHGSVNAPYIWSLTHPLDWDTPPQWTFDILWRSYTPISKAVQGACYWAGRLLLGMKAEYAEYTPVTDHGRGDDDAVKESLCTKEKC